MNILRQIRNEVYASREDTFNWDHDTVFETNGRFASKDATAGCHSQEGEEEEEEVLDEGTAPNHDLEYDVNEFFCRTRQRLQCEWAQNRVQYDKSNVFYCLRQYKILNFRKF